jgi:uncharacterized protein (TIGR02284 family)
MNATEILNSLVPVCIDSERGYRHAAKDVGSANFESFFIRQAESRKRFGAELEVEGRRLGIDRNDAGSFLGFLDREFMDFSVAMSKGDTGIVEWCRKDDEAVIRAYEQALTESPPRDLRTIIERQLLEIRRAVAKEEAVLRLFGGPRS